MNCNNGFKGCSERHFGVIGALGSLLLLAVAAVGQAPAPVVSLQAAPAARLEAGTAAPAKLVFAIAGGFHIQSDHPNSPFLIPTTLRFAAASGLRVTAVHWPKAEQIKFSYSPTPLAVFSGNLPVLVEVRAAHGAIGAHVLEGTLHYQACNATLCRPPASLPVQITVRVAR